MTQLAEYHQPKEKVSDSIRCKNSMWRFFGKLSDSFDIRGFIISWTTGRGNK